MSSPPGPDAEALAWVHRGWDHLRLQRPLAAWAAWQRALRIKPGDPAATQALDLLASADDLPAAARATYRFRPPRDDAARARWDARFRDRPMDDLDVAGEVFGALADADPADAPARYNQALCLAWLGENVEAIEALDRSVRLDAESFPDAAVEAWMLAEILRQGGGAEELADDLNHTLILRWTGAADPVPWLSSFADLRPVETPADARTFEWLDRPMPRLDGPVTVDDLPRVRASVVAIPGVLRLSSPDRREMEAVEAEVGGVIRDQAPGADRRSAPLALAMMDAAVFQFRLPDGLDESSRHHLTRGMIERYFEGLWIHTPRHGLGTTLDYPVDAESPAALARGLGARRDPADAQARLEAVIRIREQLAARPRVTALYCGYPFDRLRRRVGLEPRDPATADPADVSCMGEAELERLDLATLDVRTLAEAFESALMIGSATADRFADALAGSDLADLVGGSPSILLPVAYYFAGGRQIDRALDWLDRVISIDEDRHGGRLREALWKSRQEIASSVNPEDYP